jgi:DNA-binding CsgD family transcriptional regulator
MVAMELVGRDAELHAAEAFAAQLREGLAALVIGGAAGIGKTAVWHAARDDVEALGAHILATRASEVEMPIPLGHLADLFAGDVLEVARELPEPQRAALAIGLGTERAASVQPDWLALARATLALLTRLAAKRPVVLAIDDLQWLDPGSRRVLAYAVRRAGPGVGILATVRDETGILDPLALADAVEPGRYTRLELAPLSAGALQRVLRTRLGAYVPRPTLSRIHEASGGNPLFAIEFARLLGPGAAHTGPLAVPRSLEEVVAERVSRLPPALGPLLETVSALERPTATLVRAALGEPEQADEVLEAAVAAEALTRSADGLVSFTHPLLAAAVYHRIPPARRRRLHGRLAQLVEPVEERGRHAALACEEKDAAVAAVVAAAADAAAARGALHAAAALAAEVARVTPDPEVRQERLIEAAAHHVDTGEFAAARDVLDPLLAEELPPAARGRALLVRAEAEIARRELLIQSLRDGYKASGDERVRWQALIRLAQHEHWITGDAVSAAETARRAADLAHRIGDRELIVESEGAVAFYDAALGRRTSFAPEPEEPLLSLHAPWWNIGPGLSLATRLMWAGLLDDARRAASIAHERLATRGREARAGFLMITRSEIEWRAGRWDDAADAAAEATDVLGDLIPTALPRLMLLAARGDEERARRLGADVLPWAEPLVDRYSPLRVWWSIGELELARGDPQAAAPLLEHALRWLERGGLRNPGCVPIVPDAIECFAATGRTDEAAALASRHEEDARALDTPWAKASALQGRAIVELAEGETAAAVESASAASTAYAAIGAPLNEARARLLVGDAHRRAGERRAAAEEIRNALELFQHLGAALWQERAERELRRASPRARKDRGALTAAEQRVASLVAAGRTNKQVAAELFTTIATVEAHLTRIYRKLGIRSRTELTRRVSEGTVALGVDE